MVVRPGFTIELVAAEPLVMDRWPSTGGRRQAVGRRNGDYPRGIDGQENTAAECVTSKTPTAMESTTNRRCFSTPGLPVGVMPWRGVSGAGCAAVCS